MRGQGRRIAAGLACVAALIPAAGCGTEDKAPDVQVSDAKIVKALDLQEAGKNYSLGGDTNCLVSGELLNNAKDVSRARDDKATKALVVEAKSGGFGVVGIPIFPPECGEKALKALAKVKLPK
jgi:hypothetical protein